MSQYYVLHAPRVAPGNDPSTAEPTSGVLYDVVPQNPQLSPSAVSVNLAADQYRTSILMSDDPTQEFLVWAANTSSFTTLTDWYVRQGEAIWSDADPFLVYVRDNTSRSLLDVAALVIARGDQTYEDQGWVNDQDVAQGRRGGSPYFVFLPRSSSGGAVDLRSGVLYQDSPDEPLSLESLGGLSSSRGDRIIEVVYRLQPATFWWSRNDAQDTRFGWDAATQRWAPRRGAAPASLGPLLPGVLYTLPSPPRGEVGDVLDGTVDTPDSYAPLRLGALPDASSIPLAGVRIVSDQEARTSFDFSSSDFVAIVGVTNGVLQVSPTVAQSFSGSPMWYVPDTFTEGASGDLGPVTGPIFLTPIPEAFQRPFLRINNRSYLTPTLVLTEADLPNADTIAAGECVIALSTGKVLLSPQDIARSTVTSPSLDKHLVGARVYYDGVAMNAIPQPLQEAATLVQGDGVTTNVHPIEPMYLGLSSHWGSRSGVLTVPDGSGVDPSGASTSEASLRTGGDTLPPVGGGTGPTPNGLIRQIEDGLGDTILFGRQGAIARVQVVDRVSDVPSPITEAGVAYVTRAAVVDSLSAVFLSPSDRKKFVGEPLYFLQASMKPSYYAKDCRIFSRKRFFFEVPSNAVLHFIINWTSFSWEASSLPPATRYSAAEIARSIQEALTDQGGEGACYAQGGRIVLEDTTSNYVGIQWHRTSGGFDLSGAVALGFLPGWISSQEPSWLPDSGVSVGFHRNPNDPTRSRGLPDLRDVRLFDDVLGSLTASPYTFLQRTPLEDIPGYAPDTFFGLRSATGDTQPLTHLTSIRHRFNLGRIDWITTKHTQGVVHQPTSTLYLEASGVIPDSLLPELGGGLQVALDGGTPTNLVQGTDYLLEQDGDTGTVRLTWRTGAPLQRGYQGTGDGVLFSDPTASFTPDLVGSHLVSEGTFHQVVSVLSSTSLQVREPFDAQEGVAWELLEGAPPDTFDASIVADVQLVPFSHVDPESFSLFLVTPLGVMSEGLTQWPATFRTGRSRFLRAGVNGSHIRVETLHQEAVGTLAQDSLLVPLTLRGDLIWVAVGNTPRQLATPVESFSADPAGIEYLLSSTALLAAGTLRFPDTILETMAGSTVWVGALLKEPSSSTKALYDPDLRLLQVHPEVVLPGQTLYQAEQLLPHGAQADISVSPLSGFISLRQPLASGSQVEVAYYKALANGQRTGSLITETLTHFVQREPLTRLSDTTFQLDPQGLHVLDDRVEPIIYIGATQQNYGGARDYTVSNRPGLSGRVIVFSQPLPENATPVATYGVHDAQGGERVLQLSTRPIYLPPLYISAGKSTFGLRGDIRHLAPEGSLLRLGNDCIYVTASSFDAHRHVTFFDFTPATTSEIGSRSPGANAPAWVTNVPMHPDMAPAGFFHTIQAEQSQMSPITTGQNVVVFTGDLTSLLVPGHLLDLSGTPFVITAAELQERGAQTQVTLAAPVRRNFTQAETTIRVSARPIYPSGARVFLGAGPLLESATPTLVLYRGGQGRALTRHAQWDVDPQTGVVHLMDPLQGLPDERLILLATRLRTLAPFYGGRQERIQPRWGAAFAHLEAPSVANGLLGRTLVGKYTYRQPDAFYIAVRPLEATLNDLLTDIASSAPPPTPGILGPRAQVQRLHDFDRAARHQLAFLNTIICSMEQIMASNHGYHVGDRDGQFRFDIGMDDPWTPPGFEDAITGQLNPRNLFAEVFNAADPSRDIFFSSKDYLVSPTQCTMVDKVITGPPLSPDALQGMIESQRALIKNDLEDVVLVAGGSPTLTPSTPWSISVPLQRGVFATMAQSHALSRLFPTQTRFHTTLTTGIGADIDSGNPGVFSWARGAQSTWQKQIGQISNPVVGDITAVLTAQVQDRLPRAHMWGFYPKGHSALDGTDGRPCVVVTMRPPGETPQGFATGFPETSRFLSMGGDFADAIAGDPARHIPGFVPGQRIAWGFPDGTILPGFVPEEILVGSQRTYTGLYVDEVLHGCVLLFADRHGNPIHDPDMIRVGSSSALDVLAPPATVLVIPPDTNPPTDDALTTSLLTQAASSMPGYRVGVDLQVTSDGRILDISLPSRDDPALFPLKEITGQRPPTPSSSLEGDVWVVPPSTHVTIPALKGEALNDAGDHTLPYLAGDTAETFLLANLARAFGVLLNGSLDEIPFTDGEVLAVGSEGRPPAALLTSDPADGAQVGDLLLVEVDPENPRGHQGILSVAALESSLNHTALYPPRFVTQSAVGAPLRYLLDRYFVFAPPNNYPLDPQATPPNGVRLFTAGGDTVISLQDTDLVLNNAVLVAFGNLNDIIGADPLNVVSITFYSRPDIIAVNSPLGAGTHGPGTQGGQEILRVEVRQTDARAVSSLFSYDSGYVAHGGAFFGTFHASNPGGEVIPTTVDDHRHVILLDWLETPLTPSVGTSTEWFLPHLLLNPATPDEMRVSLYGFDASISVDTRAGQSTTAAILSDRLTFAEVLDMRFARPRAFSTSGNPFGTQLLETSLQVTGVTLPSLSWSSVNDVDGAPLTFPVQSDSQPDVIPGTWVAGMGSLRAAALEVGDTPISLANVRATVLASSSIIEGTGSMGEDHIFPSGPYTEVLPGDIVVVLSSTHPTLTATEKAGTYIVRHVIQPDILLTRTAPVGQGIGWLPVAYPRIISFDLQTNQMVISYHENLPISGYLHITLDEGLFGSADAAEWKMSIVSTAFTVTGSTMDTFTLTINPVWYYADGQPVPSPATLGDLTGHLIGWSGSGQELQISIRGGSYDGNPLPDDSLVGLTETGVSYLGVSFVDFSTSHGILSYGISDITGGDAPPGMLQVKYTAIRIPGQILPSPVPLSIAAYDDVPTGIAITLDEGLWNTLYNPHGHPHIGPGPTPYHMVPNTTGTIGYVPTPGIWLEPNVPKQPLPLGGPRPLVVSQSYSLTSDQVRMRSPDSFEEVTFEVRRARRWHQPVIDAEAALSGLRRLYETRRGIVTAFARTGAQTATLEAAGYSLDWHMLFPAKPRTSDVWNTGAAIEAGTQLGGFLVAGVRPGDSIRLLADDDSLLGLGTISEVLSESSLKIATPSFSALLEEDVMGRRFEIYLRHQPPQEQSWEQLVGSAFDVIHSTTADRSDPDPQAWTGGYVPSLEVGQQWSDAINILRDDSVTQMDTLGVAVGDFLVIDAAGTLPNGQLGQPPQGDTSVPSRVFLDRNGDQIDLFESGYVSGLDDNRGVYRVTSVHADHLTVDSTHFLAGDPDQNSLQAAVPTALWAILPTVSLSSLAASEGQNDLRPTHHAVGGTYLPADPHIASHSIRPFSYRILRAKPRVSLEMAQMILVLRERTRSWIGKISPLLEHPRGGTFHHWQARDGILRLTTPGDLRSGIGIVTDEMVSALYGESYAPFVNAPDCLTIMDRRVLLSDSALETTSMDASLFTLANPVAPEESFGRALGPITDPTLTGDRQADYMAEVLNTREQLRAHRDAWISIRTDATQGLLARIARASTAPGAFKTASMLIRRGI